MRSHDGGKRLRRLSDCRRFLLVLILVALALLYFTPTFSRWFFGSKGVERAFEDRCLAERLSSFSASVAEYNANVLHWPDHPSDHQYLPYVANGAVGLPVVRNGRFYVRRGRALTLPVNFHPLVITHEEDEDIKEAIVTEFTKGIVSWFHCAKEGYYIEQQVYAHRARDALLVQEVKISNANAVQRELRLRRGTTHWPNSQLETVKIQTDGLFHDYNVVSGFVPLPDSNKVVVVSIVYKPAPRTIQLKPHGIIKFDFITSVKYSEPVDVIEYEREKPDAQRKAVEALKRALQSQDTLKEEHTSLWQSYWYTGLRISDSMAVGAINGHKINSTLYYVLSQVPRGTPGVEKNVAMNEGCYRGHHTLDAPTLWKDTSTIEGVNNIVEAWLITLEKQGCHHLMSGGPSAVQQAMILSLGGLRFSNQHLEFNIDPQYLHRDYLFRRISYGNVTHLNISVTVGEDNKASLGVALDRSDSVYFGCAAGCRDAPIALGQAYTRFPVKVTRPLTAILYITADHQHMQELRSALHVHTVDEAPAHDHQVMALHKHGHQLGGLPTLFWVSICFLIIVFHLFLCKLIVNEYYGHQDRQRVRYSKL